MVPLWFIGCLCLPFLNTQFNLFPDKESSENRRLAPTPHVDITYLDPLPKEFEAWYTDHFSFRNLLIATHSKLSLSIFKRPPEGHHSLPGLDQWIFLDMNSVDNYYGRNPYPAYQLEELGKELQRRKDTLEALNCYFLFCLIPNKISIYPEFLPDYLKGDPGQSRSDQLLNYLDSQTDVPFLDLRGPLLARKAETDLPLFFKLDNHWNEYGAFEAQSIMVEHLQSIFPQLVPLSKEEIKIEMKIHNRGNLAVALDIATYRDTFPDISFHSPAIQVQDPAYLVPDSFGFQKEYVQLFRTQDHTLPKLMIIHDSFGLPLIPFLAPHFRETISFFDEWKYRLKLDVVKKERPDIFILAIEEEPNLMGNLWRYRNDPG